VALDRGRVLEVIDVYIRAWVEQDPDLILSIFTEGASYLERPFDEPALRREGIRAYWTTKVVESQANISCRLLNLYLEGDTAVAEWEASFDDVPRRVRRRMREVAILVFQDGLIDSLREYWAAEVIADADDSASVAAEGR
jgi:hypothetical protein